jgi:hypothetical protein
MDGYRPTSTSELSTRIITSEASVALEQTVAAISVLVLHFLNYRAPISVSAGFES